MGKNISLRIPHENIEDVEKFLKREGLKRREVDNTLWSYKGEGIYMNMYPSGILLIQGKGSERWAGKVLEVIPLPEGPVAGCDEVGKGDLFGPLVLCCAVITPEKFKKVLRLAPKDSKNMSDDDIKKKASKLEEVVRKRCIVIMPERFNELYSEYKNINRLMDSAYRKLLSRVIEDFIPVKIVVDKYSSRNPFQDMKGVQFVEKGERDVAVSVASILARAKFLRKIEELDKEFGVKVPKGASGKARELAEVILRKQPELAEKLLKKSFL
jgi:ribonuclease HIII